MLGSHTFLVRMDRREDSIWLSLLLTGRSYHHHETYLVPAYQLVGLVVDTMVLVFYAVRILVVMDKKEKLERE